MALKLWTIPEIPPETIQAAHAVKPSGNIYIFLRDTASNQKPRMNFLPISTLGEDEPPIPAFRLALVMV
jgi:hypothetical protein